MGHSHSKALLPRFSTLLLDSCRHPPHHYLDSHWCILSAWRLLLLQSQRLLGFFLGSLARLREYHDISHIRYSRLLSLRLRQKRIRHCSPKQRSTNPQHCTTNRNSSVETCTSCDSATMAPNYYRHRLTPRSSDGHCSLCLYKHSHWQRNQPSRILHFLASLLDRAPEEQRHLLTARPRPQPIPSDAANALRPSVIDWNRSLSSTKHKRHDYRLVRTRQESATLHSRRSQRTRQQRLHPLQTHLQPLPHRRQENSKRNKIQLGLPNQHRSASRPQSDLPYPTLAHHTASLNVETQTTQSQPPSQQQSQQTQTSPTNQRHQENRHLAPHKRAHVNWAYDSVVGHRASRTHSHRDKRHEVENG